MISHNDELGYGTRGNGYRGPLVMVVMIDATGNQTQIYDIYIYIEREISSP
jgi:hypothetical protein